MSSLFWRVFLWFWLVMALLVGLLVVLSPYWTQVRPAYSRWEQRAVAHLAEQADAAARVLAAAGPDAVREAFERRGRRGGLRLHLLDADGREQWGRDPGPEARELARQAASSGETEVRRVGLRFVVARRAESPDGRSWLLVMEHGPRGQGPHHPPPPRPIELLGARTLAPLLAGALVVVGLLSWAMARSLASPVRILGAASRRIADGDLSARAGPAVGGRRDEVGRLGRDFDRMAERLEEMVAAQRRLLRDVSHELRSPLARLSVALDRGRREVERLDELIGQLLALTRLESRQETHEPVRLDLAEVLRQVVADARFEAEARGVAVRLGPVEEPAPVDGDDRLLRSALDNVLRNAVRHAPEASEVEVSLGSGGDDRLSVVVRDHGPGVPEEALERLFEPFFRVEEARERTRGGVGLGLAIAARAVRLHGGGIRARNAPEGGLQVEMLIPRAGAVDG